MWSTVKFILAVPLLLIAIVLVFMLFFAMPVCAIAETIDLLLMRSTTVATITRVRLISDSEGSRPQVDYEYAVAGVKYTSHRFAPGWFANGGTWTAGGADIKRRFTPGQVVTIHYQRSNPSHACLEYGWFKWSIGFSLGVWGGVFFRSLKQRGPFWPAVAMGMGYSGAGLIFFGPDVVLVAQVHWFILGFCAIVVSCAWYRWYKRREREKVDIKMSPII